MTDSLGEYLVIAWQRFQLLTRRLVEIAEALGGEVGIEPVGLGQHGVEGNDDSAQTCQVRDDVGDPRSRPRPLSKLRAAETVFVDIDNGDRPHLLHPGVDRLKRIEGADAQLLHRGGIDHAQAHKAEEQGKANQPGIAEIPRKPAP